jgi:hypothetical protein
MKESAQMSGNARFGDADRDLLLGAVEITGYINSLLDPDSQVTTSVVYSWIEREHLKGIKRIGNRLIGSKTAIRKAPTP